MKKEKQLLLDEIKDQIANAGSFLVAEYSKLSANRANELRKEMAKVGGNFVVVRKRIFIKAAQNIGLKFDLKALKGHIALITAPGDPVETTKAIVQFSNSNDKSLTLVAAQVEGQLLDRNDVNRLAQLPAKDQMRAEFLGLLEAPMAQMLAVVEAVLTSVPYCLDNKAKAETVAVCEAEIAPETETAPE